MLCLSGRQKPALKDAERPPPELCGYWFQNSLSVEHKLGTGEARRERGLPEPPDGPFAWAIVHADTRSIDLVVGEIHEGQRTDHQTIKSKVSAWMEDKWILSNRSPLFVSDREHVDVEGREMVTSITVNGIKLHRTFVAMVNGVRVQLILSEAKALGWEEQCLKACLLEINHAIKMREKEAGRRASTEHAASEARQPDELAAARAENGQGIGPAEDMHVTTGWAT